MSSYSELGWWWNFHILHNIRLDAYALRHAAFVEPPGKQGHSISARRLPSLCAACIMPRSGRLVRRRVCVLRGAAFALALASAAL